MPSRLFLAYALFLALTAWLLCGVFSTFVVTMYWLASFLTLATYFLCKWTNADR